MCTKRLLFPRKHNICGYTINIKLSITVANDQAQLLIQKNINMSNLFAMTSS